jgi:hypothetical protein
MTEAKTPPSSSTTKDIKSKIEGEGSYTAAKAYDDATHDFVAKGKVTAAAAEAKRAVDSSEGAELARAEAQGKAHSKPEKVTKSKS